MKAALIGADGAIRVEAHSPLSTMRGPGGLMHQHVEDWGRAVRDVIARCLVATSGTAPGLSGADTSPDPSGTETSPGSSGADTTPGLSGTDAVLAAADSSSPQLAAIAVTGQMQDLILLGEDGRPTHPVVLYSDTRASAEQAALTADNPGWLPHVAVTPPPGPDSLPPKILHVARHAPDAMAASATALFSAAGWVAHALADVRVCDRLTASTTGLFDPRTDSWVPLQSPDGSTLVPAHLDLPHLVDPGVVGHVTAEAARTFGVPAGTPVVMALGDAGSATDGMVGSMPGSTYLHLGTTGWVAFIDPTLASDLPLPAETGEHPQHHRLVHPAGHLAIARLPSAGEALEHARRDILELTDPHTPDAHAVAEAALIRAHTGAEGPCSTVLTHADAVFTPVPPRVRAPGATDVLAAAAVAYAEVVSHVADDVAALLDRLGARPSRLPATGGVVRSPMVRQILEQAVGVPVDLVSDAEAGLVSCARVAFDALGVEHAIAPLVSR